MTDKLTPEVWFVEGQGYYINPKNNQSVIPKILAEALKNNTAIPLYTSETCMEYDSKYGLTDDQWNFDYPRSMCL